MSTVLLVDDDFENRWALQLALESRGHHIVLAENGRDALTKAVAHFPELVVTDLQMPEVDGRELCRRLRCAPVFAGIPIVLLSAMPEPVDEVCYWTVFLQKPASMEVLLDIVDTFIAARLTYARAAYPSEHHSAARLQAIDSRCWP
ncbi:CheY-like chemotaxis protein [Paraburkholderia graminis]|uniref:response regulator n=1 Tax=Paraburkholderia graminis TaxID=60548 RepID=UPI002862EBCA|nr:response regulator [Paraburkholderia graminis]MDR6472163.1 CheY-like chemotaxis protein [Paraburkholderia graminis]